jgi:hypothetical protein
VNLRALTDKFSKNITKMPHAKLLSLPERSMRRADRVEFEQETILKTNNLSPGELSGGKSRKADPYLECCMAGWCMYHLIHNDAFGLWVWKRGLVSLNTTWHWPYMR